MEVVTQSWLIHPDWDVSMHEHYLVQEDGFPPETVRSLPIALWLEHLRKDG